MRGLALIAALGLIAAAPDPHPTPAELAALDHFVADRAKVGEFTGVVLVAKQGRVLFEKAYGRRDEKSSDPATIDTRYNLASAGKMFTTVAIWQQIALHRLSLDSRVSAVLPDYPNHAFAEHVTVRHLLTHTSGAGEVDLFGAENAANRARIHSHAEMIAAFGDHPPAFPPGTGQDYSNLGYVILGRMVEKLSGEDYEDYVRRHIFAPAGLRHTDFSPCIATGPDIAPGYATIDGKRVSNCATQPERGFAAGGELSTAHDMWRFVDALQRGKLVPPALLDEAIKPYRMFMGLGFFSTDYTPDHPPRDARWGHAGSSDGECTDIRTYPLTGETIVTLSSNDPPACFPIAGYLHAQMAKGDARPTGAL